MENKTGYQLDKINNNFFVIYMFENGETMLMTHKAYKTEKGAIKELERLKKMAGVQ